MTSAFDALDALASEAAITAFGEAAVLIPRRSVQYVEAAADAERMAVTVRGVFSGLAAQSEFRGQGRAKEFAGTGRIVAEQASFWIAAAQVSALGFRPARGDLLKFPERPGNPSYAITAVHPTSMGDLELQLVCEDVAT